MTGSWDTAVNKSDQISAGQSSHSPQVDLVVVSLGKLIFLITVTLLSSWQPDRLGTGLPDTIHFQEPPGTKVFGPIRTSLLQHLCIICPVSDAFPHFS